MHYQLYTLTRDFLFFLAALWVCQSVNALTLLDGKYQWHFLTGEQWPIGYQQATGKPLDLSYARSEYDPAFFERLSNALPEARVNESYLTGNEGANIKLLHDAEISITFLHEGAGYKNALGFFTFSDDAVPQQVEAVRETIIFPNLSYPHMTSGHRLSLGKFSAGSRIGFFLAANGFWYDSGVKQKKGNFYYSLAALNPEQDARLRQHNVLLFDEESEQVVLGFEDLPRTWGDNDFNDALFALKIDPPTALDLSTLVVMPHVDDSDADGINDADDVFPNNYHRASHRFYPSDQGWSTLAFEDNWPHRGDYDMNDLVVRVRTEVFYDAQNLVSGLRLKGFIDARGAAFHNGFALRLMNVPATSLGDARITIAGKEHAKYAEERQSDLVIKLWHDTHEYTKTDNTGECAHFNTIKRCQQRGAIPFELEVNFANRLSGLSQSDFDYFIFRTNFRGREIHFADFPPTDLFDKTQFGKFDDRSDDASRRYFRDENNLPWAIRIPKQWRHPREYIDVLWAYPDYENWVESSGREKANWFELSDRDTHYY